MCLLEGRVSGICPSFRYGFDDCRHRSRFRTVGITSRWLSAFIRQRCTASEPPRTNSVPTSPGHFPGRVV